LPKAGMGFGAGRSAVSYFIVLLSDSPTMPIK
jgi:hypothetical protein